MVERVACCGAVGGEVDVEVVMAEGTTKKEGIIMAKLGRRLVFCQFLPLIFCCPKPGIHPYL
jgi:hypothetical protein